MTAAAADRQSPAMHLERVVAYALKAATTIYAGTIVAIQAADGLAVPASDTAGLIVVGRASHKAVYTDGDRWIEVERGVFKFANGTTPVALLGVLCYVQDDQTVTTVGAATNDIPVGITEAVESDGVIVKMLG